MKSVILSDTLAVVHLSYTALVFAGKKHLLVSVTGAR